MKIRRGLNKICVIAVLSAFVLTRAADASAWSRQGRWSHPHHEKVIVKQHYLSPIVRGITTLYAWALLNYRPSPEVIVQTVPAATVIVTPAATQTKLETSVVYIPNSNGSYTAVTLTRSGGGYLGPQGEYYPSHPTVEQLAVLYGK